MEDTPLIENAHIADLADWTVYRIEQWLPGGVPLGPTMAADHELWQVAVATKALEAATLTWQDARERAHRRGERTRC